MTVIEFLKTLDVEKLTGAYEKMYEEEASSVRKSDAHEELKRTISRFIEKLSDIEPKGKTGVLIPIRYITDEGDIRTNAELYVKEEIASSHMKASTIAISFNEKKKTFDPVVPSIDMRTIEIEDAKRKIADIRKSIPSPYAYEFTEWEDIVGCDVYLGGIKKLYNKYTSEEIKYDFAASIIFEMSFNGFCEESQEERREELESIVAEHEKIMALPEEERNKHFVPAKDVIAELRKKYEIDEPSKEEMDEFARKVIASSLSFEMEAFRQIWLYKTDASVHKEDELKEKEVTSCE